ncbi:hypothetical protein O988_07818 [Pseudogymnoascus sp. VKM F-3808]|nr:hypothetical protein O988_07818 [Pseudogymnoascus sp. VKM F-3808]
MAVLSTTYRGRSYSQSLPQAVYTPDPLAAINLAFNSTQGHQLLELLAAQLKTNKFIGQAEAVKPHDFDLSDGARDVMYVTCRMETRQELIFKIEPGTLMKRVIDRCLETWRYPDGRRFIESDLNFFLPCGTKIDYSKTMTAAELGVESNDLIDVYGWWHGG